MYVKILPKTLIQSITRTLICFLDMWDDRRKAVHAVYDVIAVIAIRGLISQSVDPRLKNVMPEFQDVVFEISLLISGYFVSI